MRSPNITVIIETPKESRLKFKLDRVTGLYKIDRILPKGLRFPFNFGFVPHTRSPYHEAEGNQFKILRTGDPEEASELIKRTTLPNNERIS